MEVCKLELESSPSSLQLEKTPEQQGRPNVAKNKFNKRKQTRKKIWSLVMEGFELRVEGGMEWVMEISWDRAS